MTTLSLLIGKYILIITIGGLLDFVKVFKRSSFTRGGKHLFASFCLNPDRHLLLLKQVFVIGVNDN